MGVGVSQSEKEDVRMYGVQRESGQNKQDNKVVKCEMYEKKRCNHAPPHGPRIRRAS